MEFIINNKNSKFEENYLFKGTKGISVKTIENSKIKLNNREKAIKKVIIERNYGIDFFKIFAMINVLNLHNNQFSGLLGININSPKYKSIWYFQTFSYWAVDGFGLISGIVGHKKYKFSNLLNLWFMVWFYSILYIYIKYKGHISKKNLLLSSFPLLTMKQWYFSAYFEIYLLFPIINYGINSIARNIYRNLIIFFIGYYSVYNILANIYGNISYNFLNNGYSSMWLLILYIIGAYIGKYIINNNKKNKFRHAIFYLFTYFSSSILTYEINFRLSKNKLLFLNYLSPTMILQSISLIMCFTSFNITNKWIKKIVSLIIRLNFSALFIHKFFFRSKIKIILFQYIKGIQNFIFIRLYLISIIIYAICIFIDYFRFILFKIVKIEKLCMLLEKKIPEIFDKLL